MSRGEAEAKGRLRSLPAIDRLLALPEVQIRIAERGRAVVLRACRALVSEFREALLEGRLHAAPPLASSLWTEGVDRQLTLLAELRPRSVVNATGVIIHTNLGRVPLSDAAIQAMARVARGYSDLEYDLERGRRGSRHDHAAQLLREVTGGEAALVVNNNAAAVLLASSALAAGGEIVLSRGEMVEIGGSFRIPEVIEQSGARLVGVGTTNRTHPRDYERAIGPQTRLLMKVHPSNYVLRGYTSEVDRRSLARIAHEAGLLALEDLGSGCLVDLRPAGLPAEPTVQEALAADLDVVTFSGDKLVGGPQAGFLVGKRETIHRLSRHPLMRALRPDKATLAGVCATLAAYRDGRAFEEVPVLRMLSAALPELRRRAESFATALRARLPANVDIRVLESTAPLGGGSLPGEHRAVALVSLRDEHGRPPRALEEALRRGRPPVVARVQDQRVALDLRCVREQREPALLDAIASACSASWSPLRRA